MDSSQNVKWKKAHKRMEALKGFYIHLAIYILVNITLFIVRGQIVKFLQNESSNKDFMEWVDWNVLIVPIFWGIGILFHAANAFQYKLKFIKNWEQKQLEKFLEEE